MTPPLRLLLLAAVAAGLAGCIVTRADLDRQPFSGRVIPAAPTVAVADVLFADDTDGELDRVRLGDNRAASRALADSLGAWLRTAGYAVERQVAGVGLSADSLALFEVAEEGGSEAFVHAGPLVVDDALSADPLLFASARTPEQAPRAATGAEARRVVAVLRVRGRSVPVETSVAQAALTGLLTLGRKADFDRSALRAELFLLDAETGALVWANRDGQDLQAPDVAAALDLTRQLVATVPTAGARGGTAPKTTLGAP